MGIRDMTMWNGYGDVENGYESSGFHGWHEEWRCGVRNRLMRWLEYKHEGHVVLKGKMICMGGHEK